MLANIHQSYIPYIYLLSYMLAESTQNAELTLNPARMLHLQFW